MNSSRQRFEMRGLAYLKTITDQKEKLCAIAQEVAQSASEIKMALDEARCRANTDSVRVIVLGKLPVLRALEITPAFLDQRLAEFEESAAQWKHKVVSGYTTESTKFYGGVVGEHQIAVAFKAFTCAVEHNAGELSKKIAAFCVKTNKKQDASLQGIDLMLFFIELAIHSHVGPWGTLFELLKKRAEEKENLAAVYGRLFEVLELLDLLQESLAAVAIAMRQIPRAMTHGNIQPIKYVTARTEFDRLVKDFTQDGEVVIPSY